MNTAALKRFAPELRTKLLEAVSVKLDYVLSAKTPDYLTTFATQVAALRNVPKANRAELVERVAYTWFNRLVALRFMDARGWHPFRARVLLPANPGETQPELLKLMRTGALPAELRAFTNPTRLDDLLDGRIPSTDPQGEVYRFLVLAACRYYHSLLPDLFERLDDETELLLPDDLLTEHSVIHGFRTEIHDEDCGDAQRANVEIIGWLYQFYISERKDQVMARKSAVPTEDIPAVTQLFTPHWIVRYLVENSLGRLWLLNRPHSKLREHMPYYIEGEAETDFLRIDKPEAIRICDPAVGSGHMLTYAFDLLVLMYEEEGYAASEIPALILRHNLVGLDICPRAVQLAQMALVFKAREKSRRFFQAEFLVRPNILELRNVKYEENELSGYFKAIGMQPSALHGDLVKLLHQFDEAKNFGSLIQPCMDESAITEVRTRIAAKKVDKDLYVRETHSKVLRVLDQAEALTQRYQVVVANPPFMGGKNQNPKLRSFLRTQYSDFCSDLFSSFIARVDSLVVRLGEGGLMSPFVWMFLSSYEKVRAKLILKLPIRTLIHPEYHAFFSSAFVPLCAFTFTVDGKAGIGTFIKLTEFYGEDLQPQKALEAIRDVTCPWRFHTRLTDFEKIPGSPIAYWVSENAKSIFSSQQKLGEVAHVRKGLDTGENEKFLRLWQEVSWNSVSMPLVPSEKSTHSHAVWFPINRGGGYKKWYGNNEYVIHWRDNGNLIKSTLDGRGKTRANLRSESYYLKESITWGAIGSAKFSARYCPPGGLFGAGGYSVFGESNVLKRVAALFSSALANFFLEIISPTLNFEAGNVAAIPFVEIDETECLSIVDCAIKLAQEDWDSFETSWDFRDLPLLRPDLKDATLEASWRKWENHCQNAIRRMQQLETENNRLFIDAYGLQDELQPDVPEDQITLARPDQRKDVAAFLSYAVGCMMGRYGLDHPGLILANAGDTLAEYLAKVGKPLETLTFAPDEDGILPVVDGEWFEDDIVARTRDFLRATFGEANLRENIRFIEQSLGKDLRKYFLTDFYKDHLQTYKKRPIYWMIQSPKKGFSLLLYLHRYTRDTMNLVLNRYLRDFMTKVRSRLAHLAQVQTTATTAGEKTQARKEADKLHKTLLECEEWERQCILPLAQQRVDIDLDDGVKVNYLKLGEALAPIPGLAAAED